VSSALLVSAGDVFWEFGFGSDDQPGPVRTFRLVQGDGCRHIAELFGRTEFGALVDVMQQRGRCLGAFTDEAGEEFVLVGHVVVQGRAG
jgi:hypothetical protein